MSEYNTLYTHDEPEKFSGLNVRFEAIENRDPWEAISKGWDQEQADATAKALFDDREAVLFDATVTAYKRLPNGEELELGSAGLGNCIYNSFDEFHTEYRDEYYLDLVKEAVSEGLEALRELKQELAEESPTPKG